jgi:hypothetical protein
VAYRILGGAGNGWGGQIQPRKRKPKETLYCKTLLVETLRHWLMPFGKHHNRNQMLECLPGLSHNKIPLLMGLHNIPISFCSLKLCPLS